MGIEYKTNTMSNDIIFLLCIIALIGALLKQLNDSKKIPYTSLLLLTGTVLGLLSPHLGSVLGTALDTWSDITHEAFLLVLIPPLIFGVAFNCDWDILKKEIWQIVLLSTLGVIVGALLVGVLFKYALWYEDFSLAQAFMFGGLIAATDSVTVSNTLRSKGTHRKLATLLEGEAILNDGTAMIAVEIFAFFALEDQKCVEEAVREILVSPLGGLVLGVCVGIFLSHIILKLFRNSMLIILLTLCTAYLTFYAAQMTTLKLSGVIAVSAYGLYLSRKKHTLTFSSTDNTVKEFWKMASYFSETLIFMIVSIVLGHTIVKGGNDALTFVDLFKNFGLYFFLQLARLAMLMILWPLLNLSGYKLSCRHVLMLSFGGQRGGMALALALIIDRSGYFPEYVTTQILFHTVLLSFLTIIVNGTFTGNLLSVLKLTRTSAMRNKAYLQLLKGLLAKCEDRVEQSKQVRLYKRVNWTIVQNTAGINLIHEKIRQVEQELKTESTELATDYADKEARFHFLNTLKSMYWNYSNEHQASGSTIRLLQECTDRSLDEEDFPLQQWDNVAQYLSSHWYTRIIKVGASLPLVGRVFKPWLLRHLGESYEVAAAFINAHAEAQAAVADVVHGRESMQKIVSAVSEEIRRAREYIKKSISSLNPEVAATADTKRASLQIVKDFRTSVQEHFGKGLLSTAHYHEIMEMIENSIYVLITSPPKVPPPQAKDEVRNCPLLKQIVPNDEWESILQHSQERFMNADELLFSNKTAANEVHVVVKGKLSDRLERGSVAGLAEAPECYFSIRKPGSILGLYELLTGSETYYSRCVTRSQAIVLSIPKEYVMKYLDSKEKEIEAWKYIAASVIKMNVRNFPQFRELPNEQTQKLISLCKCVITEPSGKIDVTDGMILLHGSAVKVLASPNEVLRAEDKYEGCQLVLPYHGLVESITKCVAYKLPTEIREMWNDPSFASKLELWVTNCDLKEKLTARAYSLTRAGPSSHSLLFIRRESGFVEEAISMQLEDNADPTQLYAVN